MADQIVKRIVCLANSRKFSGRCIAGKEIIPAGEEHGPLVGTWIRPVSARQSEEVSEDDRKYPDGSDPKILDVIDIKLHSARPKHYQKENWLIDADEYWAFAGRVNVASLAQLIDHTAPLWYDGRSTFNGLNDQIRLIDALKLTESLRLIHVESLTLVVWAPGADFGNHKRRVQGRFQHAGVDYALWVTDPIIETQYLRLDNGKYAMGECYLTISLGEPLNGFTYKLIAAIIKP